MKLEITVLTLFLAVFYMNLLTAEPMPEAIAVNDQTKECAVFFLGDECTDCSVPEGWRQTGYSNQSDCPDGYKKIDTVESVCTPRKTAFCCSENHSGTNGNCRDLVINETSKECAFLEDVNSCLSLSQGWKTGDLCPGNFQWQQDPLDCGTRSKQN
ncbi:MAG: hypothetical protein NTZ63_02590 [Candidatus Omnitrophica bacterium]|nr:hypothetical protein [Candidatus Omnitrophota bacterium]